METLSTIETLRDEVMTLKEGTKSGGSTSPDRDKEAKFLDPKPPNPVALGGLLKV